MICKLIRERNLHYTNNILQNEGVLVMMSDDDDIKQMRGMSVCLDFLPMDGPAYTVEWQTKTYVIRYAGMSLFRLPMNNTL